MKPKVIDWHALAVLGCVCPLATVLVLRVFPLGADAVLEEMVVGLGGELGRGSDVVLEVELVGVGWMGGWMDG